jgi:hypothetical protein
MADLQITNDFEVTNCAVIGAVLYPKNADFRSSYGLRNRWAALTAQDARHTLSSSEIRDLLNAASRQELREAAGSGTDLTHTQLPTVCLRPKAGAHHRQLSGSPVQLQSEAVRGVRLRAHCSRSHIFLKPVTQRSSAIASSGLAVPPAATLSTWV